MDAKLNRSPPYSVGLRTSGGIPLLPTYGFVAYKGTDLPFTFHAEWQISLVYTKNRERRIMVRSPPHLLQPNVYWTVHHCNSWGIKIQLDVTCFFYFTYYLLNMFRTLICPSSGACDCVDGLPHRLSCVLLSYVYLLYYVGIAGFVLQTPDCWLEVSIRKVLRPATSTQVFLGFPVPKSECWDGSQDSKLPLHASHVARPT